jgi:general secretion pathway protein C
MSRTNFQSMSSVNLAQLEARLKPLQQHLARVPLVVWQRLVLALLVVWLAYVLSQAIWIVIPKPAIPAAKIDLASTPSSSLTAASTSDKSNVDIDQLKKLTPFGNPAAQVKAPENQASNIEQEAADTQLNLILRGLVYSSDEKVARAVIASSDKQEVYAVGDPIPMSNNVTVAKILADRVIINNNGKFESLWLFKDDPNAPRIRSRYPSNPSIDNQTADVQPPVYYDQQNTQNYSVPTPVEQSNLAQMGNTLSDVVAMSIHRENGQIVGYKIRPGRNADMFNSLGLQADDVVTAVNGMPLNNPGKIMEIYRSMGSATSANLQIMRNGSTVNLDISLNQ